MRLHLDEESSTDDLPPDLQSIVDQVAEADRTADSLSAALSDEQFHWQPDNGRGWSVAQCLEHLAATNVLYGDAIRSGLVRARERGWPRRGPLAPGMAGRWFIRSLEPPVKLRFRAPGTVRPASRLSREEILQAFHAAHDHVRMLIRDSASIDANRATFPNPFATWIRVTVATGLHVIPAHDRRHLWQAEQVTLRPEFPPPNRRE